MLPDIDQVRNVPPLNRKPPINQYENRFLANEELMDFYSKAI
jgi:hypothetical protein